MKPLEVREVAFGSPEYLAAKTLRDAVLRRPLGLRLTEEDCADEATQLHLLAFCDDKLLGCLLLAPRSAGDAQMRQVAVEPGSRRCGVGKALVHAAEELARARGFVRLLLHARLAAVPFYEALGYAVRGEPFVEVTLPHRLMDKHL